MTGGQRRAPVIQRRGEIRLQRQSAVETGDRFVMAAQGAQGIAAAVQRHDRMGPEREDLIVTGQRIIRALQRHQRIAPQLDQIGIARLHRQRMIEGGQRLVETAGFAQDHAIIQQDVRIVRPAGGSGGDHVQGFGRAALMGERDAQRMADLRIARLQRQQFQKAPLGPYQIALGERSRGQFKKTVKVHGVQIAEPGASVRPGPGTTRQTGVPPKYRAGGCRMTRPCCVLNEVQDPT